MWPSTCNRPAQTLQEGNQQPHLRAQGLQSPHACEEGIAPNDWQENLGPILQQGSLRSGGRGVQQRPESLWVQQRAPVHREDHRPILRLFKFQISKKKFA